jgi:hypothetical protein
MGRLGKLGQKTQNITGAITLACGFFMMWGSARGSVDQHQTQQELYDRAVEVDPRLPSGDNNGTLVLAAGQFSSSQQLEDELLRAQPYLVLRRRVEMYQWTEQAKPGANEAEYRLAWTEGQVDFFKFQNPTGHENPLLRFEPFRRSVESASFAGFDGGVLLRSMSVLLPVELRPEMLTDPSLRLEGNKIYVPRVASDVAGAQLGDMRVWYEALPQGEYTVLTVQRDERNLVGAEPSDQLVVRPGRLSKDEFFGAERKDTGQLSTGLLYLGGVLFFTGLCSVLNPIASRISLRPHIPADGMLAVVLVSAGLSLLAVCIFFVAGYF